MLLFAGLLLFWHFNEKPSPLIGPLSHSMPLDTNYQSSPFSNIVFYSIVTLDWRVATSWNFNLFSTQTASTDFKVRLSSQVLCNDVASKQQRWIIEWFLEPFHPTHLCASNIFQWSSCAKSRWRQGYSSFPCGRQDLSLGSVATIMVALFPLKTAKHTFGSIKSC